MKKKTPPPTPADEKYYQLLLESSRAIPWKLDLSTWCFTHIGKKAKEAFGYDIEQWYQPGFWEQHVHPDDRQWAKDYCQKLTRSGTDHDLEYRFITRDQKIAWIKEHVLVINDDDGTPRHLIGFMFDISEQKKREQTLQQNQRYLVQAQKITRMGYCEWNIKQGTLECSAEVHRIINRKKTQKLDFYAFISLIHPDDRSLFRRAINSALEQNNFDLDYRLLLANNDILYIHSQAMVEYDADGKAVSMFGTLQDISERKKLENALQTLSNLDLHGNPHHYYQQIVHDLAEIYQADIAFFGLFADQSKQSVEIQSIIHQGKIIPPFRYQLHGTPCDDIVHCRKELISEKVYQKYPQDKMLAELKIESYFGVPLTNNQGEVIGLVSVLSTPPLPLPPGVNPFCGFFPAKSAAIWPTNKSRIKSEFLKWTCKISLKACRTPFTVSTCKADYYRFPTRLKSCSVTASNKYWGKISSPFLWKAMKQAGFMPC